MPPARMKIGYLARETGLTTKTIRYYERQGLIQEPERAESGYRYFGPEGVERLEFIKNANRLDQLPEESRVCAIIQQGIHARGEAALTWLEGRRRGRSPP